MLFCRDSLCTSQNVRKFIKTGASWTLIALLGAVNCMICNPIWKPIAGHHQLLRGLCQPCTSTSTTAHALILNGTRKYALTICTVHEFTTKESLPHGRPLGDSIQTWLAVSLLPCRLSSMLQGHDTAFHIGL